MIENQEAHKEVTRLLRAREVADRLGISLTFSYLLMQRGEIPTVRLGRSVRVRPSDLEQYIKMNISGMESYK